MAEPFLRIEGVSKSWGEVSVLKDFTLDIDAGEFVAILGPSGCGKSTLLRLIAGLETPTCGRTYLKGRDMTDEPPSARGLSMVFQSYALFPHLNVAENIVFGLKVRGVRRAERDERLRQALALVGLEGLEARKPRELSGGQRQRVALARAIIAGHPLCLMDEPLSNLDAKLRHSVRQEIRDLLQRQLGMTLIYVTHDQSEAMSMADIVVLMRDGRIEQVGSPASLYQTPATLFAAGFIGAPPMAILPAAELLGRRACSMADRDDLLIGLRAEDVRLEAGNSSLAQARIVSCEFLGAETLVHLELVSGGRLTARVSGQLSLPAGRPVGIRWSEERTHWFSRKSGRRIAAPALARIETATAVNECGATFNSNPGGELCCVG